MNRALMLLALAAVLGTSAASPVYAQDKKADNPPAKAQDAKSQDAKAPEAKAEPKKDEEKKDAAEEEKQKKIEAYEKAIKDCKKIDGAFTLYQKDKSVLLELPEDKLGKLFLIQATFQKGATAHDLQAGWPVGGTQAIDAFRFEKKDDSLWLVRPNLTYRWDKDDPLSIASERSFPEAILSSFKIEQQHPDKKLYLLNVTRLFTGDVFRLSEIVGMVLGGPYMLDVEKTAPEKIKGFPDNSIVDMRLHYYSARGAQENPLLALLGIGGNTLEDSRSAPIRVTYNMWFRKDTGYQPRLADPRVGYFTQDFYSVSKFFNEDRTQKYIYRFDLKKKDPTAAMSEPVKPIVWVIDPSIPPQYRDAVKEGVLRWNRAYEAIGFKNAVQVIDAPNDPDYDHADGRYNVVRWTMSPDAGYAIAWTRNDPFTGETLNASVTFDANMLAYSMDEHQRVATPAAGVAKRSMDVLYRNPERKLNDDQYLWSTDKEMAIQQVRDGMAKAGWHAHECMYGTGLAESASFGWNALLAGGGIKISKETYAKQFISDVISHEVGHCLGLRHNFIGSTNLSTSELADDNCTNENGISASVMDYVPVNVMAVLKGSGNFYTPTVGPYDKWAIRYGYTDVKGGSPLGEKHELSRIASMSGQKGLAFLTDENADGWDPYAVRFDSAKDPIAYSGKMLAAAQRTRQYAITQLPKPGESYAKRTSLIIGSISQTFKQGRLAARFVGGIRSNRNFKADSGQRPTLAPVNAADQREAMRLITKHCLSAASFNLPADVLMNLSQDAENSPNWTAPLRDFIGNSQTMLVAQLMSAATTDRITENQFKWGKTPGAYTIDEHFGVLHGAIFSEVGADKNIPALRRDLQRFAISALMSQSSAGPGMVSDDVRMLASDSLKRLGKRFGAQLASSEKLDGMTKVHLRDTKESIDRFLARQYTR